MSEGEQRLVAPALAEGDGAETTLRPQRLAQFVGQRALRDNLRIFIEAAKARARAMDRFGSSEAGRAT